MNGDNTAVWIAGLSFAAGVIASLARFFWRLGKIEARLDAQEKENARVDASIANLMGTARLLQETLTNVRIHQADNYVSIEHMSKVETKIDDLAARTSKIETHQAEHGSMLKGIFQTLGDLKRAIERRN